MWERLYYGGARNVDSIRRRRARNGGFGVVSSGVRPERNCRGQNAPLPAAPAHEPGAGRSRHRADRRLVLTARAPEEVQHPGRLDGIDGAGISDCGARLPRRTQSAVAGGERHGGRRLRLLADRSRARYGRRELPGVPVCRARAGQSGSLQAGHPRPETTGKGQPRGAAPGIRRPGGDRPLTRYVGSRAGGPELHVPVRARGYRQDQPGREAVARLRRSPGDAVCRRGGQSDHCLIRPGRA